MHATHPVIDPIQGHKIQLAVQHLPAVLGEAHFSAGHRGTRSRERSRRTIKSWRRQPVKSPEKPDVAYGILDIVGISERIADHAGGTWTSVLRVLEKSLFMKTQSRGEIGITREKPA